MVGKISAFSEAPAESMKSYKYDLHVKLYKVQFNSVL